jgi:Flp pilus assembly protein TadD
MNSMAAMFYVLSFWLYVRARLAEAKGKRRVLFAGCVLAGVLSLGSKEIAVTLPFFIFLYEWYFFQDLSRNWLKTHLLPFAGLFIFLAIVALMYLGVHPLEKILMGYENRDFTLTQRMLTEFRVVIYYITLLIFPHPSRLNLDHDFPISHSLIDPITTMLSIGAIGGLVGLAIYMTKKDRLLSFSILWFLGNLVIESSVIGLEIMFEHRTYLPSMFVILMAVTLGYRYIKSKRIGVAVLFAVLLVFSVWTYERNSVWGDDVTLWKDCVAKSPKKARLQYNLGNAFARKGKLEEAVDHYSEALRIRPHWAKVHNNLGITLKRQGKLNEAINHFSEALRIKPDHVRARLNLGVVLARQGRLEEAMGHFSSVLRIQPDYAQAHNNLGVVLARQGRLREAAHHFSQVLRIEPHDAEARQNLERCLKLMGKSGDPSSIVVRP